MNRDEKRDRFAALPPKIVEFENHRVFFPREPTGGTWISANDAGVCLALINWHRIKREPNNGVRTRGEVIRKLAGISTSDEISAAVKKLALRKLRPFRLIAIVSSENRVIEWRWNLNRLSIRKHSWEPHHWFSSSFDEATAEATRARVCAALPDESAKHRCEVVAAPASLARAGARPIFHLYASPGCRNGELYRGRCQRPISRHVLQTRPAVLAKIDND